MMDGQMTLPSARNTDPDTSHMAARNANKEAGQQAALLGLHDLLVASDFELADHVGSIQTSIGVRRGELVQAGFVQRAKWSDGSSVRGTSPSGATCAKWELTETGWIEVRRRMDAAA